MHRFQEAEDLRPLEQDEGEGQDFPAPLSLRRSKRFRSFLRQELRFCMTEAEKEVILLALRRTEELIRRLEKRPQSEGARTVRAGVRRRRE